MKRKRMSLIVAAVLVLSMVLGACGKKEDAKEDAGADSGKAGLKIAIVSSPSGVDDGSFNQNNYEGIQDFIAEHTDEDNTVTPVKEETGDTAAAIQAVSDIVADYDVIICCGFQFAGIGTLAQDNPDSKFILVDAYPTDADGKEAALDNVYAMQFKEQESGFFAGVAAALETKTGKVAVVNGIAYPSNVNYQYGFEAGVAYAVKNLKATAECVEIPAYAGTDVTNADVGGNYIGDFADQAAGKNVGQALLNEGVDIMLVAAGGAGNGVFTAVKEAGGDAKVIGCDVDQYDDGVNGDKNIILTSVLKIMGMNDQKQLNAIRDDGFKGENALLGADTDSTGFVKEDGRQQLSKDTITELDKVYDLVKDGTIVPPSNFSEGITVGDFPGL